MSRMLSSMACAIVSLPFLAPPLSAAASATLSGRVNDDQGRPIPGAQIVLRNPLSNYRLVARSDGQGRFAFANIPFHEYHLEAMAPGMTTFHQDFELRSAVPLRMDIALKAVGAVVEVTESAKLVEGHPSAHLDIDRSLIALSPAPVQSRAMDSILLATPGFVADENGRFHFKGSHGQIMYVVDGVPVTDQMQATFSNSLDPAQAEAMEVVTGGISAEFGGKPVAVVNITSKSGLGVTDGPQGEVTFGAARFGTFETAMSARGGTNSFGWFVNGAHSQSNRFLDPVNFEGDHNSGATERAFTRFDWILSSADTLRFSVSGGRTRRDVVNLPSQQAAGQDQQATTKDLNVNLGWTHLLDASRSIEATLYARRSTANLDPTQELQPGFAAGGPDAPYWAWQDRSLENLGAQAAFTQRFQGGSTLKAGVQYVAYPIHERFRFAATQDGVVDADSPVYPYTPAGGAQIWSFNDHITPRLMSAYVQDDLHLDSVILALGLRHDRYSVKDTVQTQWQPRLGASWQVTKQTVLRASYDRLMVIRENENLALSLSQQAWDLGPYSGTPVPSLRPELQNSTSLGVEQQLGTSWRVNVEYWEKRSTNAADTGQFLNTGVVFPVGMMRGNFHGVNLRLEHAPVNGFSGYLSLGTTRARVQAPVVGGLQLDGPEAAPGEWFLIDHDQKLSGQLGLNWEHALERGGVRLGVLCRYDSGLVSGDPTTVEGNRDYAFGIPYVVRDSEGTWRARSRTVWNFTSGWEFPLEGRKKLELGADLMNAFNKQALFSFLSECGGTHVIPPRTWALHAKLHF